MTRSHYEALEGELEKMLDEILDLDSGLNSRELKFVEDMDKKRGYSISEAQANWIKLISERLL